MHIHLEVSYIQRSSRLKALASALQRVQLARSILETLGTDSTVQGAVRGWKWTICGLVQDFIPYQPSASTGLIAHSWNYFRVNMNCMGLHMKEENVLHSILYKVQADIRMQNTVKPEYFDNPC